MHLEAKRGRTNTHRSHRRGRYGAENGPSKVARHSQVTDGKLTCSLHRSSDVIFWLGDQIAKLKTCQISILAKIAKFNARQFFRYTVYVYFRKCVHSQLEIQHSQRSSRSLESDTPPCLRVVYKSYITDNDHKLLCTVPFSQCFSLQWFLLSVVLLK